MFSRILLLVFVLLGLELSNNALVSGNFTTQIPETNTTTANKTEVSSTVTTQSTTASTSAAPNTTVLPVPTVPVYKVENGSNICLLAQFNLKLLIPYYNKKGDMVTRDFYINSTNAASVKASGTCGNDTESLELEWWPEREEGGSWRLVFIFNRVEPKTTPLHFSFDDLFFNFTIIEKLFPDTNESHYVFVSRNVSQFTCPIGSYFQCMAKQTLQLVNTSMPPGPSRQQDVYITLSNTKVEAFRASAEPFFVGSMRECSADYVPNKVVPIVVGVALAVLIVIALLTFIIGIRRRQAGYQEI
jgi:hypothetical protein